MQIIQIVVGKKTYNGKEYKDVTGLGDDSNVYSWHAGKGQWLLDFFGKSRAENETEKTDVPF